jgi:hypothetical protein
MAIRRRDDVITYTSRRRWPAPRGARSRVVVQVGATAVTADPLADFLTARWGLHTRRLGQTFFLPNSHQPWPLVTAELIELDTDLLDVAGLAGVTSRPPDSVLFSSGVRTQFGAPVFGRPEVQPQQQPGG